MKHALTEPVYIPPQVKKQLGEIQVLPIFYDRLIRLDSVYRVVAWNSLVCAPLYITDFKPAQH